MAAGRGASSRLRLLTTCSKRKNNKRSDPHAHTILTGMSYLTRHACCVALRPCFRGGAAAAEPVPSVDMVKVNELFDEFSTDEDDTESLNMEEQLLRLFFTDPLGTDFSSFWGPPGT